MLPWDNTERNVSHNQQTTYTRSVVCVLSLLYRRQWNTKQIVREGRVFRPWTTILVTWHMHQEGPGRGQRSASYILLDIGKQQCDDAKWWRLNWNRWAQILLKIGSVYSTFPFKTNLLNHEYPTNCFNCLNDLIILVRIHKRGSNQIRWIRLLYVLRMFNIEPQRWIMLILRLC